MRIKVITFFFFIMSVVCLLGGWTTFRFEGYEGKANVIKADTPLNQLYSNGQMLYKTNDTAFWGTSINAEPIIVGDYIYTVNSDTLYKLDKMGNVISTFKLDKTMNSTCRMAYEDGVLYIPIADGTIEAVSDKDGVINKVWTGESFSNQSLAPIVIYGEYIYSGTTNGAGTEGVFYCLDKNDGHTVWTYTKEGTGFYWCGAAVYGSNIYYATDEGDIIAHSLIDDSVVDCLHLTDEKIRAGLALDKANACLYIVSKNDGTIHKLKINADGTLSVVKSTPLISDAKSVYSTSTPTIYDGRLYVGCSLTFADTNPTGAVAVLDSDTLTPLYYALGEEYGEVKSCPLLSVTSADGVRAHVYVTANKTPGTLYTFDDTVEYKNKTMSKLYVPESKYGQYTYASVVADDEGTLYYGNDSGALFKIVKTDKPNIRGVSNVSVKKLSKKKIAINYSVQDDNVDTFIYIKYNKKSYKKYVSKSKTSYNITYKALTGKKGSFKKKDKLKVKIRTRMKLDSGYAYSAYTKVVNYTYK